MSPQSSRLSAVDSMAIGVSSARRRRFISTYSCPTPMCRSFAIMWSAFITPANSTFELGFLPRRSISCEKPDARISGCTTLFAATKVPLP